MMITYSKYAKSDGCTTKTTTACPVYELRLHICGSSLREDPVWMAKYEEKVSAHNAKVLHYLSGNSGSSSNAASMYVDAGFDLFMPVNGAAYGAGADIMAAGDASNGNGGIGARLLPLGVKAAARVVHSGDVFSRPTAFYLYPRSSISKTPLRLANSVGIIDAGYRGELLAAVDSIIASTSRDPWLAWQETLRSIKRYDRLFQICMPDLSPFLVNLVDDVALLGSGGTRGEGGLGSTGR
jgi:dUTPase